MVETVKSWFRHSLTILWARVLYIGGIIGAGVATVFASYDYTELLSLTWAKFAQICAAVVVAGIVTEVLRRRSLPPKE